MIFKFEVFGIVGMEASVLTGHISGFLIELLWADGEAMLLRSLKLLMSAIKMMVDVDTSQFDGGSMYCVVLFFYFRDYPTL